MRSMMWGARAAWSAALAWFLAACVPSAEHVAYLDAHQAAWPSPDALPAALAQLPVAQLRLAMGVPFETHAAVSGATVFQHHTYCSHLRQFIDDRGETLQFAWWSNGWHPIRMQTLRDCRPQNTGAVWRPVRVMVADGSVASASD